VKSRAGAPWEKAAAARISPLVSRWGGFFNPILFPWWWWWLGSGGGWVVVVVV
jgi:hypothetical protein